MKTRRSPDLETDSNNVGAIARGPPLGHAHLGVFAAIAPRVQQDRAAIGSTRQSLRMTPQSSAQAVGLRL